MFPAPNIQPSAPREQLLDAGTVALWLRVPKTWVYKHSGVKAQQPQIPCVRVGRYTRFRAEDVQAFIDEQLAEAARQLQQSGRRRAA